MELVADESVDYRIITALRHVGFTVFAIIDEHPAIKDPEVLRIATGRDSVLVTQDKDFGELVFRMRLAHSGVLLIRLSEIRPEDYPWLAQAVFDHFERLQHSFAVFTGRKLRFRSM